ncbi:MAG: zinc finger Ran-binding domain-containing protein, partial [Gemmatimonadetes bacterium]|nr:zinc finger Ran-binding domain-containing protein [Gemmatimonadota bacterium]
LAEAEDDWEPSFPDAEAAPVSPESLAPADEPPAAADVAGADEWDPFGAEFGAPQEDVDEALPWLEGIDEAAKSWTPPAPAVEDDAGLDFLRDIEESARTPEPATGDLGADDLAFLEELDRAIGAPPASIGGVETPAPPPAAPPPAAAPGAAGRAEPLLCKECGAINEPHSWYCEICGSEL